MKLTNHIRDAFVRGVMADVPSIDYFEMAKDLVQKDAVKRLPPKVKALYADPALRDYVSLVQIGIPGFNRYGNASVFVYGMSDFKVSESVGKETAAMAATRDSQHKRNQELQEKLKGAAYAVTTRKALVEMLPEFEKYLAVDEAAACKTLPVIANLVSDLVKAGWPKGVKPSKRDPVPV